MDMKTILIHETDTELSAAWANYLSQDCCAVLTSTDSLEAAEIISMMNVDSLIISSNNPATFLLLGKVLKSKKRLTSIVAVTKIEPLTLQMLLETEAFTALDKPFTFGTLKRLISNPNTKTEVRQNAFV